MLRFIYLFSLGFSAIFLFGNLQCEDYPEEAYFLLRDWQAIWLDNSGHEPIEAENPIPRQAFGIRLVANLSSSGHDTLLLNYTEGISLVPLHWLQKLEILAVDGFDTIAAGENISNRFRVRQGKSPYLQYLPLDNADHAFNYPSASLEYGYRLDLLMVDPPSQPGQFLFEIKIYFDSLATPLNRDTSFTLPALQLI